jgi:Alpha/beta hydrolase domain
MSSHFVARAWISRRLVALVAAALLTTGLTTGLNTGSATAAAASPTVAPITGGFGVPQTPNLNGFDLGTVGYQQSEVSLSGTATAYSPTAAFATDGKWAAAPSGTTATYTTRAVVYRPIDPKKFNGTVIVEWLNVSGGVDANPDWTMTHNELIRDGFAWVGVSAQAVGMNATKAADPTRYVSLSHPGDSFSYDIFSQAGQAIRDNSALVLGGLTPQKIIAAGESQSAARLVTYINAVHPLVHVYDGFLVHSRSASGSALSQAPQPAVPTPSGTMIRNDLDVPVFVFETETDVVNSNTTDRQPDTNLFRLWEVAGSAHFDWYGLAIGPTDTGDGQGAVANLAAMQNPSATIPGGLPPCGAPINTGGTHWVLNAAVYALNQWVVNGVAPAPAPLLETVSTVPLVFAKDANGNTQGGVRSPQVDAPVATLGAIGQGPSFCFLFGTTAPYPPSQLSALYKNHGQFVSQWGQAAQNAVKGGFLLQPDAVELKNSASRSQIGK